MGILPIRLIKYDIGYSEFRNFCKDCVHYSKDVEMGSVCGISSIGIFPIDDYGVCLLFNKKIEN